MNSFLKKKGREKLEYISILLLYPLFLLFNRLGKTFKLFSTKKRQITASILSFAIILGTIPVVSLTAFAASDKPTKVRFGQHGNMNMVSGSSVTYFDGQTVSTAEPKIWYLKYDPSTVTVTMRNYTATLPQCSLTSDKDLNIVLEGANYIYNSESPGQGALSADGGDLTVSGSGSLAIQCSTNGLRGMYANGKIEVLGKADVCVQVKEANAVFSRGNDIRISNEATFTATTTASVKTPNNQLWGRDLMNVVPQIGYSARVKTTMKAGTDGYGHLDFKTVVFDGDYNSADFSTYRGIRILPTYVQDASNLEELKSAVANSSYSKINILKDIEFTEPINITRGLTLAGMAEGNVSTLKRAAGYTGSIMTVNTKYSHSDVTLTKLHFAGERTPGNAPAIVATKGNLIIGDYSQIYQFDNTSGNGGAIYVAGSSNECTVTLKDDVRIYGNSAVKGGAVYNKGRLNIYGGSIQNNSAKENGGGIYQSGGMVIDNCFVINYNWLMTTKVNGMYPFDDICLEEGNSFTVNSIYTKDGRDSDIYVTTTKKMTANSFATVAVGVDDESTANRFKTSMTGVALKYEPQYKRLLLTVPHPHCICGSTHRSKGDHTEHTEVFFTPWEETDSLPTTAGNYYLENDVTLKSGTNIREDVNICLNGHKIINPLQDYPTITVGEYGYSYKNTVSITDCKSTGKITSANSKLNTAFYVRNKLNLYGGTISGYKAYLNGGGAVYTVKGAVVNMYGGTITENSAYYGGGVYMYADSEFNMYGGLISKNNADYGGGVYLNGGISRIYGGNIKENTAKNYGGGIASAAQLEIKDSPYISNNKLSDSSVSNITLMNNNNTDGKKNLIISGALTGAPLSVSLCYPKYPTVAKPASGYTITKSDLSKIDSEDSAYITELKNGDIVMTKNLKQHTSADFIFTAPSDLSYSGQKKTASVTAKSGITCGKITVLYYDSDGNKLSDAPKNAGTYTVKINVAESSVYSAADGLTSSSWKFKITPAKLSVSVEDVIVKKAQYLPGTLKVIVKGFVNGENENNISGFKAPYARPKTSPDTRVTGTTAFTVDYYYNGYSTANYVFEYNDTANVTVNKVYITESDYTSDKDLSKWQNGNITITPANGYTHISVNGSKWEYSLTLSKENENTQTFYLYNSNDHILTEATTVTYKKDSALPLGEIEIEKNSFKSFINKISFGLFFKKNVDVKIKGSDALSGVKSIEYQKVASSEQYSKTGNWVSGSSFSVKPNEKFIVYAKITDNAGNCTIINSQGVVVYSSSSISVSSATFDLKADKQKDITIGMTLNGNVLEYIKSDGVTLVKGTDYTATDDAITLKKDFLKTLQKGERTIRIVFSPLGVNGDTIEETSLSLTVVDTTHQHNLSFHTQVKQTCLTGGNDAYWSCSSCGKYFADNNGIIDESVAYDNADSFKKGPLGHNFVKKDTAASKRKSDANCTDCAVYYYSCDRCNATSTDKTFEDGQKLGHLFEKEIIDAAHLKSDANCTSPAIYFYGCKRCDEMSENKTFTHGDVKHSYDDGKVTKEATAAEEGTLLFTCKLCKNEKKEKIGKLVPKMINGNGGSYSFGNEQGLVFESDAAVSDILEVLVDGKSVNSGDYSLSDTKAQVTLKTGYLMNLAAGNHTLSIKSVSGTATAQFTIAEKEGSSQTKSPITGVGLWITICISALAVLTGVILFITAKKKKISL